MPKESKKVEPKFTVEQDLTLKNAWALQVSKDGLPAKVTGIRTGPKGEILYMVEAHRPPVPMTVVEADLEK